MKITMKSNEGVKYTQVNKGDCFSLKSDLTGTLFMKTDQGMKDGNAINCVDLGSGKVGFTPDDTTCYPVKAEGTAVLA